jgi:drug/metabolite transporter (DMT)-like permease
MAFGLAACWGGVVLVNKRVLDRVTPLGVNFVVRLVALAAELALTVPLTLTHAWPYGFGLNWVAAGWIALNATLTWVVAFNTYYYALRAGRVSVVAPIISTDPLWTAVFAALLLGAALGLPTLAGLLVAMAGVLLISRWSGGAEPEVNVEVLAGAATPAQPRAAAAVIALAVLTAAGWGLNPVIIELAENAYGRPSAAMMVESQALGAVLLGVILLVRRSAIVSRRLTRPERREVVTLLVAAGILEAVFAVGYYLVIGGIGSVLTTLIVAASPVFSLAGGALFLRERVGARLALGAGVTLGGVLLATAARLLL